METITGYGCNTFWNGYSSKAFAVFGIPAMLLFFHLLCMIFTSMDPKAKNINKKIFLVVLWICPLTSLFVCSTIYMYNAGYQLNVQYLCAILVGILYLILGNFIPKTKPNYSIGFRVPWALYDSDNWYHTHRFGGKCMVAGGIAMIVTLPFQNIWLFLALAFIPAILPGIYSYLYYRKTLKSDY